MNEDLKPFCQEVSPYKHPIEVTDGVLATNRQILVFKLATDTPQFAEAPDVPAVEMARTAHTALAGKDITFTDASSIAMPRSNCPACAGFGGMVNEPCDECDGDGEFENGTHTYECRACDGDGTCTKPSRHGKQCDGCHGTGLAMKLADYVPEGCDTLGLNQILLKLLQSLPDAQISRRLYTPQRMFLFTWRNGFGCLMPMKR